MDTRIAWFIAAALGLGILSLATSVYWQFSRDARQAYDRLESYQDVIAQTACGPVQYTTIGDGQPVLVIHGIMGGIDQGLFLAEGHVSAGYQAIAPSRFGYLGSPLPTAATPAVQADAFACLLDTLGLQQAAVLATSAGATSALHFALEHRDRCSCLVLISPNAPGEVDVLPPPKPIASVMYRSDFGFWALTKYFRRAMVSMLGVPEGFDITSDHETVIGEVIDSVLPVKPRADGALFDLFVSNPAVNAFPLEDIAVPVLVIGALDDPMALFRNTEALARRIPGAELITIEDGGHMMLGHDEEVRAAVAEFLERHREEI